MWYKIVCGVLILGVVSIGVTDGQLPGLDECTNDGCRLSREAVYFVIAPAKVHPNMEMQVSVGILRMYYRQIHVKVSVLKDKKEEQASATYTFQKEGNIMLQMKIPNHASEGDYFLRVEGTETGIGTAGGYVFENITELAFDMKQCSVLIQLNKPFYRQGQTVYFRVMPVERNLLSRSGSMNIHAIDATGTIVKRWLAMQTNAGVLNAQFQLSDQPAYGDWKIQVEAFGYTYEKSFEVHEFFLPAINVNVSMPVYYMEDEWAISGVVTANLSLGQPAKGAMKVKLEVRPPKAEQLLEDRDSWPVIEREERYFPGTADFLFTMDEIREVVGGDIAEKEIYVEAWVRDWYLLQDATGSAITVIYPNDVQMYVLGDQSRTYIPDRPMDFYFAVVHRDGTPLNRIRRQVRVTVRGPTEDYEELLIVGDDGLVHFQYIPDGRSKMLTIEAYYDTEESSFATRVVATRVYSQNNSYIHVASSTAKPMVDEYMVFTVSTNTYVERVFYVITSGGNIVTGGFLDMNVMQKTFSVALSRDMIPQAHMIVWYFHKGSVIADSLNFFVNGTRLNSVDVLFNRGKDFTGDKVEVSGRTDPSSYLGVSAVDYDLYAYGWTPFITEPELIRELESFDSHVNHSFKFAFKLPEEQEELIHFPAPSYGIDSNRTFMYAGLIVLTDAYVTRYLHTCNETIGEFPCMSEPSQCYYISQWCDGIWQCQDGKDEMGCPSGKVDPFTPPKRRLGLVTRHYVMDGDWLWGGHYVMPNGRLDVLVDVPDEPMSWVLGGFGISRNLGFGIIDNPVRHTATRDFYMRVEAPEHAVRGEQIGVRIGLFNYWDEHLECLVMLHDSDDYRFVVVEDFGIVKSYDPRTIRGDVQTMVYLKPRGVYEIQMPVLPVTYGCITVKISARTFLYEDHEELTICTKYDGVTNYLHTPYFIDLVRFGSKGLPDLAIPVPENFVIPQEKRHLYVPGSPKATVGVHGDVVGPGFVEDFLNAENTLRKPYGGAEQNIYNFAFNLYYLLYFRVINQLSTEILQQTTDYLDTSFQRQMGYMNEDGSISMFRDYPDHTPSIWVTAFTLEVLNDATRAQEWEFDFFVPIALMNKMTLWLCAQQQNDGSFREISPLYDRKMWPKNYTDSTGKVSYEDITMTAYVLSVFGELSDGNSINGDAATCRDTAKTLAVTYLENAFRDDAIQDTYQVALTTYALNRVGSSEGANLLHTLMSLKRVNDEESVYWADKEVPSNRIIVTDNVHYHQPRDIYDNEGYAVEATAYALLTLVRLNYLTESEDVMMWLQSMRNTFSAQASTHDSAMALKALLKYAETDTNRHTYGVQFQVIHASANITTKIMDITPATWVQQQTMDISPVWGSIRGNIQGTGLAMIQLATEVNVEFEHQIKPEPVEKFFQINQTIVYGENAARNQSILIMNPCARWVRPDISNQSGLAVLEVHVPTGYIITNDVLRSYVQSGDVPTLRRAEAYGRKVVFYFDYLTDTEWTCVKFTVNRWFPVANMTIQHTIKVYDYYEPGMFNNTLYTTMDLFYLHLCQVCGSFQCPYCPYYNTAATLNIGLFISLATTVIAMLIIHRLSSWSTT